MNAPGHCPGCGYALDPDTGHCPETACQREVCAADHPDDVCTACDDERTARARYLGFADFIEFIRSTQRQERAVGVTGADRGEA